MISRATRLLSRCVALTVVIAALLSPASGASAQVPSNRFFGSLGGGYGKSGPASSLGQDQFTGATADLALGIALTSRGVIALDVTSWSKNTPIGSSRSTFGTVSLHGYPFGSVLNNLFFQGGFGVGHGSFPLHPGASTTRVDVTHPALLLGVGLDVPVACPVWITPFFQTYDTFGGHSIQYNGTQPKGHTESANAILFHAGLAIKFSHPGAGGHCRERGNALGQ
ncbi:MAG: hypothetical protein ACJ796_20570 [Gemmatimonadaceae bacterium]